MFTRSFWVQAGERAVKSAAQMVIVAWGLDVAASTGAVDAFALDWRLGLGAAAGGAILSLLTSLLSAGVGPSGTPSTVQVDDAAVGDVGALGWSADDFPSASLTPPGGTPVVVLRADQPLTPEALQQLTDEWLARYASDYAARHVLPEDAHQD